MEQQQAETPFVVPQHWSYSNLSLYDTCPQAWWLRYVKRETGLTSFAQERGTVFHEKWAEYADHCFRTGLPSDFDFARQLIAGYDPRISEQFERAAESWQWEWGKVVGGDLCPVEEPLEVIIPGGYKFVGRVDLVQRHEGSLDFGMGDDLWIITDFKTGWPTAYEQADPPDQQLTYAYMVQKQHEDAFNFELRYWCAGAPFQPKSWHVEGVLDWIGLGLQKRIERILADKQFKPKPGNACKWCNYEPCCPLSQSALVRALKEEDPVDLAAELAVLDARRYRIREAMQKRVIDDADAGVTPSGDRWGWENSYEWVCSNPDVVNMILEPIGMTYRDLTEQHLSSRAVDKILKDERVGGKLADLFFQKVSSRSFKCRKPQKTVLDADDFLSELFAG